MHFNDIHYLRLVSGQKLYSAVTIRYTVQSTGFLKIFHPPRKITIGTRSAITLHSVHYISLKTIIFKTTIACFYLFPVCFCLVFTSIACFCPSAVCFVLTVSDFPVRLFACNFTSIACISLFRACNFGHLIFTSLPVFVFSALVSFPSFLFKKDSGKPVSTLWTRAQDRSLWRRDATALPGYATQ